MREIWPPRRYRCQSDIYVCRVRSFVEQSIDYNLQYLYNLNMRKYDKLKILTENNNRKIKEGFLNPIQICSLPTVLVVF